MHCRTVLVAFPNCSEKLEQPTQSPTSATTDCYLQPYAKYITPYSGTSHVRTAAADMNAGEKNSYSAPTKQSGARSEIWILVRGYDMAVVLLLFCSSA